MLSGDARCVVVVSNVNYNEERTEVNRSVKERYAGLIQDAFFLG